MVEYKGIEGLYESVQKLFDLNIALLEKIEVQDRLINAAVFYAAASQEEKKKYEKLLKDVKNLNEVHTYKIKEVLAG